MKLKLYGVPKRGWQLLRKMFSADSLILFVWRMGLLVTIPIVLILAFSAGPGGMLGLVLGFVVSTILAYWFRDEVIQIVEDMWNMEWGEAEV